LIILLQIKVKITGGGKEFLAFMAGKTDKKSPWRRDKERSNNYPYFQSDKVRPFLKKLA
jgi:hypothetical protein